MIRFRSRISVKSPLRATAHPFLVQSPWRIAAATGHAPVWLTLGLRNVRYPSRLPTARPIRDIAALYEL
jgi:hypothetical protein